MSRPPLPSQQLTSCSTSRSIRRSSRQRSSKRRHLCRCRLRHRPKQALLLGRQMRRQPLALCCGSAKRPWGLLTTLPAAQAPFSGSEEAPLRQLSTAPLLPLSRPSWRSRYQYLHSGGLRMHSHLAAMQSAARLWRASRAVMAAAPAAWPGPRPTCGGCRSSGCAPGLAAAVVPPLAYNQCPRGRPQAALPLHLQTLGRRPQARRAGPARQPTAPRRARCCPSRRKPRRLLRLRRPK